MPAPAELTPQHVAIRELIAQGTHKLCQMAALRAIWTAAFREKLEWKHFRGDNRYLYLGLIWDTDSDEWKVQYARTWPNDSGAIHFSRSVESFFSTVVDADFNECLRFTPLPVRK